MIGFIGMGSYLCTSFRVGDTIYGEHGRAYIIVKVMPTEHYCHKGVLLPRFRVRYSGAKVRKTMDIWQVHTQKMTLWRHNFVCWDCCPTLEVYI